MSKITKKIIAVFAVVCVAMSSFVGCGNKSQDKEYSESVEAVKQYALEIGSAEDNNPLAADPGIGPSFPDFRRTVRFPAAVHPVPGLRRSVSGLHAAAAYLFPADVALRRRADLHVGRILVEFRHRTAVCHPGHRPGGDLRRLLPLLRSGDGTIGGRLRLLPSGEAYLPAFLTVLVTIVLFVIAAILASAAAGSVLLYILCGYLFVLTVYYIVKLM